MNANQVTAKQIDLIRPDAETRELLISHGIAPEDADRQYILGIASDAFKEVHGFRPRWIGNYTLEEVAAFYFDTVDEMAALAEAEKAEASAHALATAKAFIPHLWTVAEVAHS